MLQEHTLGKQFQTRPNAEHFLLLFAAHGPLFTNPGPLLGALGPLLGRSWPLLAALEALLAALGPLLGALGPLVERHAQIIPKSMPKMTGLDSPKPAKTTPK